MSVKDRDLGWQRIKQEIAKMNTSYVQTGIQEDEVREDGMNASLIAASNEFGTDYIPERSFIRSSFDQNMRGYERIAQKQAAEIFAGRATVKRSLEILGTKAQADIQGKITSLREPPNAPGTIQAKGSSNPLIDTGTLRSSIRYMVKE